MAAVSDPRPEAACDAVSGAHVAKQATHAAWFAAVLTILAVSRWALFPRYLITFDEINFALSIDHFDPRLAQPQPPGYPVFVGLLKLLSFFLPRVEIVFLVAGLLVSAATLMFVWRLGGLAAGRTCGVATVLLLLFNPAFWLAALTNPVRLCFAAGATAVALCLWLAVQEMSSGWFLTGAAVLGVSAGARPALLILMAPLMLWAGWLMRLRWKVIALSSLCAGAGVLTWLPVTLAACGGPRQFASMLAEYSQEQMGGSSLLFGASVKNALAMAWEAAAWSCLGVLSWIWVVPLVLRRARNMSPGRAELAMRQRGPQWGLDEFHRCPGIVFDRFAGRFLALWFFPGLLFYATFHVGDPDHTLSIVPATCLAGAIILSRFGRLASRNRTVMVIVACVLLNIFLFFKPITKTTKASTYKPVRWMRDYVADVIEGIRTLPANGPTTVVFDENITGWRLLSYYEPETHIIVVMRPMTGALTTRHINGRKAALLRSPDGVVTLPSCGTLAWVDPILHPVSDRGTAIRRVRSRVYSARAAPGESFTFRHTRFQTENKPCRATP